jgi:hypothetical protein
MQVPFSPRPGGPVQLPGPMEQVIAFCLVYLLFLSLVLIVLPQKLMDRVIQIAFHLRTRRIAGKLR